MNCTAYRNEEEDDTLHSVKEGKVIYKLHKLRERDSPTYESPRGLSIWYLFAKLVLKHATNHTQTRYKQLKI